ncbi:ABC transporter substrate-binding protein [Frondihabitans sucicola]|uniref:ABC transporter substrate-binding protein n=1 Tax=Frondihabitans sucicola TaxID=1268041 RepID=A0ABN6Y2L8_9MICO|nr:extracellular solute-binding protein [Frondihabitans sucicola]BDZ51448.1 ABC transporter substrate-binding protein [Frondihabitans sucicola]
MQRRKRYLALALAAVLPIALLSACSSSSNQAGGKVQISMVGDSGPANQITQKKIIALFEKAHPNITVKFEPATGDNAEQGSILRLGQGDPSLDVVTTEVGYEYQWYKQGWISSLSPYFSKSDLAKVDPHLVANETTSDGQFLAIPMDNSTMYLAVNLDLLKKAGVTPPPTLKADGLSATTSGVWTWEDVLAAAKKVHATTGETGLLFPADEAWPDVPMAQQLGGKASSPDGLKVKGYLDQKPWVDLMTKWKAFFADDVSQITNPTWTNDQFQAGKSAFALTHIGGYNVCAQVKFSCDAAAEPSFAGGKKVVQSTGIAWALNAKSQHKKEAAEFLKFALTNPTAQDTLINGDYFAAIPILKTQLAAMSTSPKYKTFPESVKVLGAWQEQHWPQKPMISPSNATEFTAISDALKNVRVGAETPQQAVTSMTSTVDRDLKQFQ